MASRENTSETPADAPWNTLRLLYMPKMQEVLKRYYKPGGAPLEGLREKMNVDERRYVDAFHSYTQVTGAIDSLNLILVLARRKPNAPRILPMESLRFFSEAYLQQVFIVRERLLRFIRFHKKEEKVGSPSWLKLKAAEATIRASFEGPNAIRNMHVHEVRHDTNQFSWASGLELIARAKSLDSALDKSNWKLEAKLSYEECRDEFLKSKKAERKTLDTLLDYLALQISPIAKKQLG